MIVHKQIFLPFRTRLGIVAKQHVIQAQSKQLLRCEQRHTSLFRRAVSFPLVALYARRYKIGRCAFTALCTWQNVIERQVFRVLVLGSIGTGNGREYKRGHASSLSRGDFAGR